jgi:hypothetical protein
MMISQRNLMVAILATLVLALVALVGIGGFLVGTMLSSAPSKTQPGGSNSNVSPSALCIGPQELEDVSRLEARVQIGYQNAVLSEQTLVRNFGKAPSRMRAPPKNAELWAAVLAAQDCISRVEYADYRENLLELIRDEAEIVRTNEELNKRLLASPEFRELIRQGGQSRER